MKGLKIPLHVITSSFVVYRLSSVVARDDQVSLTSRLEVPQTAFAVLLGHIATVERQITIREGDLPQR